MPVSLQVAVNPLVIQKLSVTMTLMKIKISIWLKSTAVLILFFSAELVSAATAKVVHIVGEALAGDGQALLPIKAGEELPVGDTLQTGSGSWVIVDLGDAARIKVGDESTVTLRRLGSEISVELKKGRLYSDVQPKKVKTFVVHTKSAVMGVRGTKFFAAAGDNLWMCVKEGKVEVELYDKPIEGLKRVLVPEGKGVFLRQGRSLTSPQSYAWTKEINWEMEPDAGEIIDLSRIRGGYIDLLRYDYD